MSSHHYIVSHSDSHWTVSFHGSQQGPFTSKDEAVEAAVLAARISCKDGIDVEVLVQDIESNFHTAWKSTPGDGAEGVLSTSV